MTPYPDNKFYKKPYNDLELDYLKRQASLKKIFSSHLISSIPVFLIFIVISFIPFVPHPTRGYGAETPSSFSDYIHIFGKDLLIFIGFVAFAISITTIIDFIKARLDISFNFKKVGNFEVTKIVDGDDVKLVRLKRGHKFKIKSSEPSYERIKEKDIVEITRTATNRRISFKLLTE